VDEMSDVANRLMTEDETTLNVQWVGHYSLETIDKAWKAFDRVCQRSPERAGIEARAAARRVALAKEASRE
jgi:hypothetical protein